MSYSPAEPTSRNKTRSRVLAELFLAIRFGLVGILATTIHITVVWTLLSTTLLQVLVANTIAFASAFGVSFAGNYLWTFGSPCSPRRAMLRFLTISASAFLLNTFLLGTILEFGWFDPTSAAISSAAVIPVITFLASRFWGFKYKNPAMASANSKIEDATNH